MTQYKTLGDLLGPLTDAFGILLPVAQASLSRSVLKNWSNLPEEERDEQQQFLNDICLYDGVEMHGLSEQDKRLVENFALSSKVKNISFSIERSDKEFAPSLSLVFDRFHVTAYDYPNTRLSIGRDFEVARVPSLFLTYEINPEHIFLAKGKGFYLSEKEIPEDILLREYATSLMRPEYPHCTPENLALLKVKERMDQKAEGILVGAYKDVRGRLKALTSFFDLTVGHHPETGVKCSVEYRPFISKNKAEAGTSFDYILNKLDDIEDGVNRIYNSLDLKQLESFEGI